MINYKMDKIIINRNTLIILIIVIIITVYIYNKQKTVNYKSNRIFKLNKSFNI